MLFCCVIGDLQKIQKLVASRVGKSDESVTVASWNEAEKLP